MKDQEFIGRKVDHIRFSLVPESEASESNTLDRYRLEHDSLPDLDLDSVSIASVFLGMPQRTPFFIAGMTAGHPEADLLNRRLAAAADRRGWGFGIGSQRRELDSEFRDTPVPAIRRAHPDLRMISNLGIAQLIETDRSSRWKFLLDLLERSGADAIAIHLNPLQEAIQREGTPNFKGGSLAISKLIEKTRLPVILKETGSGMSRAFLSRIAPLGVHAVDVSGLGGTHWGRIEGLRAGEGTAGREWGRTFASWGIPTAASIENARLILSATQTRIWASGGIRSGLDAAKCIALGASAAGFARPALEAALIGDEALEIWMERMERELRIALFCTNSAGIAQLTPDKVERTPSP